MMGVPIDAATFKAILSRWASGVTVVTCRHDGSVHGMTASAFCSVSLEPPLVLVCVARHNRTHEYIGAQGTFGIHILGADMEEISDRCAGFRGPDGHCLNDVPIRSAATGAPILADALAWMDCSLWRAYDGGDHTIFVGEIQAGGVGDGSPLLWFRRGYRQVND